jgi:hypothetical protein
MRRLTFGHVHVPENQKMVPDREFRDLAGHHPAALDRDVRPSQFYA